MKNNIQSWYKLNPVIGGVLLCVFMVVTFQYYFLHAITPPPNLLTIDRVTFSSTVNANSNHKKFPLQKRILPDDWLSLSSDVNEGWYQAKINFNKTPDALWAIYFPMIQMSAKIYFNNILVGQIGEFGHNNPYGDPFARMANQPHYFTLPENLLNYRDNELTIHVQTMHSSGLLGKIYLAEDKILRPIFKKRLSALITAKQIITAGMLAIAILMSVLWILRMQDHVYGWYALMLYTWSAHNIFAMGIDAPLSQHTQNILSLLALGWFVVFMVKATHHYMGQQFPIREKAMLATASMGSLLITFSDSLPWSLLITHQIWSTFVLALAGYALLDFTVKFKDRQDLQNPLIIPAGFSMLAFGLHDWLLLMQILPRDASRLLHFSAPVAVSVFGALLLERFAKTLRQAESLNLELEGRVAEKHKQLEENYQQLNVMEHKQILTDERERFMKEIHDGVGGHLISMLSMVRSGKQDTQLIVNAIEAALSDLRIMIDSLTPQEHDIPSLLGAMRMRIEPQLESSGLKLHWQVSELPVIADFGPHKALQVMRIVQETITNVIRHAEAKNIVIKAFAENENNKSVVIIEISDDGKGILPDTNAGRGLGNMHYRANEIGADLTITNTRPGTTTRLCIYTRAENFILG